MSTDVIRSTSPQRPSDVLGQWPDGGAEAVDAAVARARAAAPGWRSAPAAQRSAVLHAAAERLAAGASEVADLVVREVGKPRAEAVAEVARGVAILRFYAQGAFDAEGEVFPPSAPGSLLLTRRRPRGVVGLITPWNFPVAIPLWKLAPALAYGNVVVLKPASQALATAEALRDLFADAPDDVVQVVAGGGRAGARLPAHPDVDAVSFTGSVPVGRSVVEAGARGGIPVQAEMGGQNPAIVLADADLDRAAAMLAGAAMGYAGQKCTATRRVIAVGDPGPVVEAFAEHVRALGFGDPARDDVAVGPVIDEGSRRTVLDAVERATAAGGRVVAGGEVPTGDGWFVAPTVVADVAPDHELATEEVFGPVCAVIAARDLDEAVRIANATRFGLVAAVYTRDLGAALDVANRLEAGLVRVNAPTTGVDFHAPFGGDKDSGIGPREQGRAAREFYTSTATVTIAPPA